VGIIVHRWNITVGGLFVPLAYTPGTIYKLPTGNYQPALVEWGIAIGVIGYALTMLTLGIRFLPLFGKKEP
jgi:Ni/Fe-hydrogenase subunit HybB-like protein